MDNDELKYEYESLAQEIKVGSVSGNDFEVTQFFRLYSEVAAENGDTPDLEYCPVLYEGPPKYRVDGYAMDLIEGENSESGELYLSVCEYYQDPAPPVINAKKVGQIVDYAERFLRKTQDDNHVFRMEEEDPEYQLSLLIRQYRDRIQRVRVVIFTNGQLKTRKNVFDARQVEGVSLHTNVIDIERYARIINTGSESVEVDFVEDFGGGIECLSPSVGGSDYSAYLFAIPGAILANVFAEYGNRLLEQNVRTYLQARTNVNKGILRTISEEPRMFLAYNNGITATASEVNVETSGARGKIVTKIKNFQIVNGGQTTASLLYARDSLKKDLSQVYVQVKLSVIGEDSLEAVVPRISEYANTQNKVSLADLASNSPAQVQIQRLSQAVHPPQKAGYLHVVKWFYERSRGQYKSLFAYKTVAERKKLELEYPKNQLIVKTDLAKFEYAFEGKPHVVCLGAQKCFLKYTADLSKLASGDGTSLNEVWYKRAVAKAILFKQLDIAVQRSGWYRVERGYKAQILAYTVAACAHGYRRVGKQIDLDSIWEKQEVPAELCRWMVNEARVVAEILKNPPANVRNIAEFAKKEVCWTAVASGKVGVPTGLLLSEFGIDIADFSANGIIGKREEKRNKELEFDLRLVDLIPNARKIFEIIKSRGLVSPKNSSALRKLETGNINLNAGEKNALKAALERIELES